MERFLAKVKKDSSGCWLWTGGRKPTGYGNFKAHSKSTVNAHRWSYEQHVGPIPDGLVLDHLCRVRHCVNPAHLEPVTTRVNLARGTRWPAKSAARPDDSPAGAA
jgi:hypothetical protein